MYQVVASIDEEEARMGACLCGGRWVLASNSVEPFRGCWVDIVGVKCVKCRTRTCFEFDITPWFAPRPGVWGSRPPRIFPPSSSEFVFTRPLTA